jgi:hypothetical protein
MATSSKKSSTPAVPVSESMSWVDAVFRPIRLAKLALLVGVVALAPYVVQRLPNLSARPEFQLATKQIRLIPAPEHPVPENLLDASLPEKLAAAFERHPWVARVVSVRKSSPPQVTVEVEYRQPVGMIQVKGGRFPIDAHGVILPPGDFTTDDLKRFPTIQGPIPPTTLHPGVAWKDSSVQAAAKLAQLLAPKWSELKLVSIIAPSRIEPKGSSSKIVLKLQTIGGSQIVWGRGPETEHPGELTTTQKVGRLQKYLTEFGGFDRPNGPYEIDIRHWQEISRRPLASETATTRGASRVRH